MHEAELGVLIPIIAVTLGLSIPIVRAVVNFLRKRALIEAFNKERIAFIEKGMTPPAWPDELLRDKGDDPMGPTTPAQIANQRHGQLTSGLITLFVGLAILFGLAPLIGADTARTGLIPIGIGLALLLAWALRGRSGGGSSNSGTP